MSSPNALTYGERAARHRNDAGKTLLQTMERKMSNLCVSVDVISKQSFLDIVDVVGPFVCLIKTHIDIIEDFDQDLLVQLEQLSQRHDFMIFEDRKFADIGSTVVLQYSRGVHKIASWSHITNAHAVSGPSVIKGLASVGLPLGRGLLLLAEMSVKGSLATGFYTEEAIRMARENRDFVIGFIAQKRFDQHNENEDFLILTPGIGLDVSGDSLGQQYRTPQAVIVESGCDVIIVGRGIYGNPDTLDIDRVKAQADRYQKEGWRAYEERLQLHRS